LHLGEALRDELDNEVVMVHTGEGSFKGQLRRAERHGARVVLLLGDEEVSRGEVSIKSLCIHGKQDRVPMSELWSILPRWLAQAPDPVELSCHAE
jgi:histidyl-tRNA synthetase